VDAAIERVEHRIEQKRMLQEYEKAELEALRLVREGKLPQARKAYENAIEIGRNLDERPASYDKISAEVEKLKTREGKSP
jgi:predicted RNA polymerase sigma factor